MVYCEACYAPYGEDGWCDVVIPNEIWNSLNADLLCFRCMTKRLEKAGYSSTNPVPVIVASGPYKDANEEWRLIGLEHGRSLDASERLEMQAIRNALVEIHNEIEVSGACDQAPDTRKCWQIADKALGSPCFELK